MCSIKKEVKVVQDMFKKEVVHIGTVHAHTREETVLINGRSEYSPRNHRRDWADLMLHYNLYVKRNTSTGLYVAGSHEEHEHRTVTDVHPGHALVGVAFKLLN